jgi:hypothetical protein
MGFDGHEKIGKMAGKVAKMAKKERVGGHTVHWSSKDHRVGGQRGST